MVEWNENRQEGKEGLATDKSLPPSLVPGSMKIENLTRVGGFETRYYFDRLTRERQTANERGQKRRNKQTGKQEDPDPIQGLRSRPIAGSQQSLDRSIYRANTL